MRNKGIKLEKKCMECGKIIKGKQSKDYCSSCRGKQFKDILRLDGNLSQLEDEEVSNE